MKYTVALLSIFLVIGSLIVAGIRQRHLSMTHLSNCISIISSRRFILNIVKSRHFLPLIYTERLGICDIVATFDKIVLSKDERLFHYLISLRDLAIVCIFSVLHVSVPVINHSHPV